MEVGGWVMEMLLSLIRVIAITIILRVVHDIRVFEVKQHTTRTQHARTHATRTTTNRDRCE